MGALEIFENPDYNRSGCGVPNGAPYLFFAYRHSEQSEDDSAGESCAFSPNQSCFALDPAPSNLRIVRQ